MSKKLTPLEALKILNRYACNNLEYLDYEIDNCYCILETALKEYEELQNDYCKVIEERGKWQKETQKKLKALEIIKEKQVEIGWLLFCFKHDKKVGVYNSSQLTDYYLTKKEFDLLKEVLSDYEK